MGDSIFLTNPDCKLEPQAKIDHHGFLQIMFVKGFGISGHLQFCLYSNDLRWANYIVVAGPYVQVTSFFDWNKVLNNTITTYRNLHKMLFSSVTWNKTISCMHYLKYERLKGIQWRNALNPPDSKDSIQTHAFPNLFWRSSPTPRFSSPGNQKSNNTTPHQREREPWSETKKLSLHRVKNTARVAWREEWRGQKNWQMMRDERLMDRGEAWRV